MAKEQKSPFRLVGDIGGTNARFALLSQSFDLHHIKILPCKEYGDFSGAVKDYLSRVGEPDIDEAAFAIANPITGDRVQMTNHRWNFSIEETRRLLGLERLIFKNDYTTLAMSIPRLDDSDLWQLGGEAKRKKETYAVIGPGTGLGVSGMVYINDDWFAVEGEGGHVTLSPGSEREYAIMRLCQEWFGHVSAERLVSGPGLSNIYRAICMLEKVPEAELSPSEISQKGVMNSDPYCAESIAIFCGLLGSVAGDLVLTLGAYGGLYLGGGIAPKIKTYLQSSTFRQRFESKGRMRMLLKDVPVYVITAPTPALIGISQVFNH